MLFEVFDSKCRLHRALSDEEVCENPWMNQCLTVVAARGTVLVDVDQVNMVKGKGKKGEGGKGQKGKGKGKGNYEKGRGQGDERRCFHCDGKGHVKSNCPQKVIDDKKRSD